LIAEDMAAWITRTFPPDTVTGLLATASAAEQLANGVADRLREITPLRVTLTPYSCETGRIGTDINIGAITAGDRFLALNDVTTRGNCVSKLGKVITDNGARLIGMMVFARRDSGQFPLMKDLVAQHPFYYTADLEMPQWDPAQCPLCRNRKPLLSWKDMPEI
jgi:orotate phosphoribosyltransferase